LTKNPEILNDEVRSQELTKINTQLARHHKALKLWKRV